MLRSFLSRYVREILVKFWTLRCEKQRIVLTRYSNIYIPINYSQVGTLSFVLFRVMPLYEQNLIL